MIWRRDKDQEKAGKPAKDDDKSVDLKRFDGGAPRRPEEPSFMQQLGEDDPEAAAPAVDADPDAPHAKVADKPLRPDKKPDHLAHKVKDAEDRQQALLDEGVEETFPASDPVSVKRIT